MTPITFGSYLNNNFNLLGVNSPLLTACREVL